MQTPFFKFEVETLGEVNKINDVVLKQQKTNLIKDWPEISSKFTPETLLTDAFSEQDAKAIKSIVQYYFRQIKRKY